MIRLEISSIALITTLTIQSMTALCLMSLPAIAPAVAQSLDISAAYVGAYIAIAHIAAITAALLTGSTVRRLGAIRASQIGLLSSSLGMVLCAIPSLFTMAAGALLIGFGYGPITPASSHLLTRTTPPERMSFVFSIKQTGVPLGGALAGIAVPVMADLAGWQIAFLAVAGATLACAVGVQPLRTPLDIDRNPASRISLGGGLVTPLRLILNHRSLTILASISFLFAITQLSLTAYLATYLHDDLGMGLVTAGMILAVTQGAGVIARPIWGYLADHFTGSIRMLSFLSGTIVLCALAFLYLGPTSSSTVLLIVLAIFGSCAIGWNGVFLAEVARQAPKGQAGLATGGVLSLTYLGIVVGPPLFGVLATAFGSYGLAYVALVVPAGFSLLLLHSHRKAFTPPIAPDATAGR